MQPTKNGFILLHRKILDNISVTDYKTLALIVYLLLKVNYKDKTIIFNNKPLTVHRGQLITGRKRLAKETGLSEQQIRDRIRLLKEIKFITSKRTNKFSIITICNYDYYQTLSNFTEPAKEPTRNQQGTTNKEYIKNNNINKSKKTENQNGILYEKIISYLNQKTKKTYLATTNKTKALIKARTNEGFTVENFYTVIDNKCKDWLHNNDFNKFLRPETLFSTKFESYLNQNSKQKDRTNGEYV